MSSRYVQISVSGSKITIMAQREEDIKRILELLKRFGIYASSSSSRCG